MKPKIQFQLFLIPAIISLLMMPGCSSGNNGKGGGEMPEKRPEKLVVEYHEGGGMQDESSQIYLSMDSSYYYFRENGVENKYYFKAEPTDFDNLWKNMRTNFFNRIKTRDGGEVHDRGGTTIRLSWDKESISISNSGSNFIENKWEDHYDAVEKSILAFSQLYLQKQYKEIPVKVINEISGPLADSISYVQFEIFGAGFFDGWSRKNGEKFPGVNKVARMLPGKYRISLYAKIGASMPEKSMDWELNEQTRGIEIIMKPDRFEVLEN